LSLPHKPPKARLFFSVMGVNEKVIQEAVAALEQEFGLLASKGDIIPFDRTRYYEKEMGGNLVRLFAAFRELVEPDRLPWIKLKSNELEKNFAVEGNRRVNLDPGYLTAERVVLATGKNFTHRIYLGQGIYADLTLMFHRRSFRALPWTYPDYSDPGIIGFMNNLRRDYMAQLRKEGKAS
jgi:hypothetical protein